MPKSKYQEIFAELKSRIENGGYPSQSLLPSENDLVGLYGCSRNTVRRAIADLIQLGYVQPQKGKGVRVIFEPVNPSLFMLGGIESLWEASKRNDFSYRTRVRIFSEMIVDRKISEETGFEQGKDVYYIERIRYINGKARIIDHSYFLRDVVTSLSRDICEKSIYEYLENVLHIDIATTKRIFSFHLADEKDKEFLDLEGFNSIVSVSNSVYSREGVLFEVTESRHVPGPFQFYEIAVR